MIFHTSKTTKQISISSLVTFIILGRKDKLCMQSNQAYPNPSFGGHNVLREFMAT